MRAPTILLFACATLVLACSGGGSQNTSATATDAALRTAAAAQAPTPRPYAGISQIDDVIHALLSRRGEDISAVLAPTFYCYEGQIVIRNCPGAGDAVPLHCVGPYRISSDDAVKLITKAMGGVAAWNVYAVIEAKIPETSNDGYWVGLKFASGNSGLTWHVTPEGKLIGVDPCGLDWRMRPDPALHYLYGPTYE